MSRDCKFPSAFFFILLLIVPGGRGRSVSSNNFPLKNCPSVSLWLFESRFLFKLNDSSFLKKEKCILVYNVLFLLLTRQRVFPRSNSQTKWQAAKMRKETGFRLLIYLISFPGPLNCSRPTCESSSRAKLGIGGIHTRIQSSAERIWQCRHESDWLILWTFARFIVAVRYGRVPKRSRDRGGSTNGDECSGGAGIRSPGGFADPSTPDSSDSCGLGQQQMQIGTNSNSNGPSSQTQQQHQQIQQQQQQQQQHQQQQQQQIQLQQRDPESRQLAIYDTILTVSQAHHAHCAYTEEKTRNIVRTPIPIVSPSSIPNSI